MPPQAAEEVRLFLQAREIVHRTIRTWYPDHLIIEPPELVHGDTTARMFAWQTIANGLASNLNYLALQVMYSPTANYHAVIGAAREHVYQAAHNLWPRAQFSRLPMLVGISIPEEFEQYRLGAIFLAQELAPFCARAFELRAARQRMYQADIVQVQPLPSPVPQPEINQGGNRQD